MSALEELWRSAAGDAPMPRLPDGEAEAFLALVDALAETKSRSRFERRDLSIEDDPFPEIALGAEAGAASLVAGLQITELVAVTSPRLSDMTIYVDPLPDHDGRHRLYIRDEEDMPGMPWAAFASVEEGAEWMAAQLRGDKGEPPDELDDDWELSPWSGGYVLEMLMAEDLPAQWRRVRAGQPLEAPVTPDFELEMAPGTPHWRRAAALWLLLRTLAGKDHGEVGTQLASASDDHAAFVAHLRDLHAAAQGEVPGFVHQVAEIDGPLAGAARAWVGSRASTVEPESPFVSALKLALGGAVREMISAELIEIEEESIEAAIARMVIAAESANNAKQLIAAVVRATLDAPEVDEVYGSDTELRSVFIRHFEG